MNSKEYQAQSVGSEKRTFSYKNQSDEDKIRMVKEVISKEIPINGHNFKKNIDIDLFNKCTRDFVETQNGRFVHNVKSEVTLFEINHLKNQNKLLKQLIAELSHENLQLKNRLFNNDKLKISG